MRLLSAALKSTRLYYKTAAALAGSAALCGLVLSGALATGDAVRQSLTARARMRLGPVESIVYQPERSFGSDLGDRLRAAGFARAAGTAVYLRAVLAHGDKRAPAAHVLGVSPGPASPAAGEVWLNPWTAGLLGAALGDTILIQTQKPSLLPAEAPMGMQPTIVALRVKVARITDKYPLCFDPNANQELPFLAVVDRDSLADRVGWEGRANLLLIETGTQGSTSGVTRQTSVRQALDQAWNLSDAGYEVESAPHGLAILDTQRVFIEPSVARAASGPDVSGYFGYFVDTVRKRDAAIQAPYVFVAAGEKDPVPVPPAGGAVITEWLARDIRASAGDTIELRFRIPNDVGQLEQRHAELTVAGVIPVPASPLIRALTPRFPGLSDMVSCRDWRPGMPLDLSRITPRDEAYWRLYQATPRLFLNFSDADRIFANPFGNRTALCFAGSERQPRLTPEVSGFVLDEVRRTGLISAAEGTDFSGLFVGLSSLVVLAGLLLGSLTLGLSLRRRAGERETLRALGWPPGRIRAAVVVEVLAVVLPASIPGAALGLFYDRLAIYWLNKIWASASAGPLLQARFSLASAAEAVAATLALFVVIAIWHAHASGRRTQRRARTSSGVPAALAVAAALAAVACAAAPTNVDQSIRWFGVGLLALACCICGFWWFLSKAGRLDYRRPRPLLRWMHRRRGRCVGEAALLSVGVFLVLGIGGYVPRVPDAADPHSGTGGFSWLLQTSLPVTAQEVSSLPDAVGIRVREGADASCLNLNRSKVPPVWGVDPGAFFGRFGMDWSILDRPLEDGSIPAVSDTSVITWGLARRVGDSLDYVDESGRAVRVTLVAGMPDSIFQGALLVSEKSFKRLYPSEPGYRRLLVTRTDMSDMERALRSRGLAAETTSQRLSRFMSVEATYLSIFVVLGGLGVALGSIGFALLCFRTLTEEARSIAILSALGWPRRRLLAASWGEHVMAWLWGAAAGTLAAATALVPQAARVNWRPWAAMALLIWACGAAALFLAAALKPQPDADLLRPE